MGDVFSMHAAHISSLTTLSPPRQLQRRHCIAIFAHLHKNRTLAFYKKASATRSCRSVGLSLLVLLSWELIATPAHMERLEPSLPEWGLQTLVWLMPPDAHGFLFPAPSISVSQEHFPLASMRKT